MLFSLGHGDRIVVDRPRSGPNTRAATPAGTVPLEATGLQPVATRDARALPVSLGGHFRYYFEDAPNVEQSADALTKLDALATAMTEEAPGSSTQNSKIPPIYTYLGQFIDHDITANTDREQASGVSVIDGNITPLPRADVTDNVLNLRSGSLGLDSLYGDGPDQGAFAIRMAKLMRHPTLKAKMFIGMTTATDSNRPPLPADPATDLLRLKRLMADDIPNKLTLAELNALPPELKANFVDAAGQAKPSAAIIGDGRNDENLIIAQLHLAFLRMHNKMVDASGDHGAPSDAEGLFAWAKKHTRWHYQWLVAHDFLPTVCDPAIVDAVMAKKAPLYSAFYDKHHGTAPDDQMPLPLEFSVAAFRFGHSMVRGAYDHNRFFGAAEGGSTPIIPDRVGFDLLFTFTGGANPPFSGFSPTLPDNWIIEWERFIRKTPALPIRVARKIDSNLAPPLADLQKEPAGVFKNLAKRNLRRSYLLNIPYAQDIISKLNASYKYDIKPLTAAELGDATTGTAITETSFLSKTPLWFYLLKEAEKRAGGEHLGPLGSTLVAETLIGLLVKDPTSYWNQSGSDNGRWGPQDGVKDGSTVLDSIPAMLKFAGVLA